MIISSLPEFVDDDYHRCTCCSPHFVIMITKANQHSYKATVTTMILLGTKVIILAPISQLDRRAVARRGMRQVGRFVV
jgi:hypothetical protein